MNSHRRLQSVYSSREMNLIQKFSKAKLLQVVLQAALLAEADSVVVVVQAGSQSKPGGVLGAAQFALK